MPYVPVPESELTEEEVRRGFNRLRELYQGEMHRVHEMKVERGKLNVLICDLQGENARLKKQINQLQRLLEKKEKQPQVKKEKIKKEEKPDFKKKFLDSL